jgi:hypothetical protein
MGITTVFAAGAALIGLNWYQAEHRYRRDREEVNGLLDQMNARLQVNDDTIGEVASSVRATRVELEQYIQAQARRRFGRNDASMSIIFQYFQELEESTSPYQRQFLFAQLRNYIESQSRDSDFREVVSSPAGLQMVQRIGQIDPNMDNPDAQKILDILTRTGARRG